MSRHSSARKSKQNAKVRQERKEHHNHQVQVKGYVLVLQETATLVPSVCQGLHHAYGFAPTRLHSSAAITGKADISFEHTNASQDLTGMVISHLYVTTCCGL